MWRLWLACTGETDPRPPGDASGTSTAETGAPGEAWSATPTWVPNAGGARLVGFVEAEVPSPRALEVTVDDGVSARTFASPPARTHRVRVLGLRPDAAHTVTVRAEGLPDAALSVVTEPLPPDLPAPSVTVHDRAAMEPGVTLLVMADWMVMYDADGVPVWLRRAPSEDVHQVGPTPRGTLLLQADRTFIAEMALTGEIVRSWRAARRTGEPAHAVAVDALALHHDVVELPDGNLLGLSIERRTVPAYPTSEDRPRPFAPADVAGDVVIEFRPDGAVVHEWSLLDRLEPGRIGYDAVDGDFWHGFFGGDEVRDWSHANAIAYDPDRNEIVVSLRHQDAVVALDRDTGEVRWIVAPDAHWPPPLAQRLLRPARPDLLQPYHQHAARIGPGGHLLLFDNGNGRASALAPRLPDDENWSRGAELALDHAAGTWDLVWEWGPQLAPPRFSGSLGDTDALPLTGNRLVTFGNVKDPSLPGVSVFETTGGADPRPVWALEFPQGDGLGTFRAERLTGVIPGR